MSSNFITTYLSEGLDAALPASPTGVPSSGAACFYYATDTKVLRVWDGSAWQKVGFNLAPVPNGGTGQVTLAAHGVVIGAGTSGVSVTGAGTSGQVLTSNGASADPTFQSALGTIKVTDGVTTVSGATEIDFTSGATVTNGGGGIANVAISGGGGSLTLTDGVNTVASTTQITVTGGTVGGSTPNATLTISGGSSSRGLFTEVMSALPTVSSMGYSTALNVGSMTQTNVATGVNIFGPSQSATDVLHGHIKTAPSTPYKATLLFVPNDIQVTTGLEFGWYDGSAKLITMFWSWQGTTPSLRSETWTTTSSRAGTADNIQPFVLPIWLQLSNDGTTYQFNYSYDGINFKSILSASVSGAFISSFSDLFLGVDAYNANANWVISSYSD